MEQHPVPQNVTTFQFRLIGDMTIKQFGYLAGGAILAYISYKLPVPFFFSWPLAIVFAVGGVGFAFIPIEERPMDVWVLSFIRNVYNPTLYVWDATRPVATKQQPRPPVIPSVHAPPALPTQGAPAKTAASVVSSVYTTTTNMSQKTLQSNPNQKHDWFSAIFASKKNPPPPAPKQAPHMSTPSVVGAHLDISLPPSVSPNTKKQIEITQQKELSLDKQAEKIASELTQAQKTDTHVLELQKQLADLLAERKKMEQEIESLKQSTRAPVQPAMQPARPTTTQTPPPVAVPSAQTTQKQPTVKIITPEGAVKAGLPRLTTFPNVVTGITKDGDNNLLPGVLVTVKDKDGIPVRALKTNRLGQFAASTPLANAMYFVEIEDPRGRFVFDRVQITLNGSIVPALEIIAKSQKQITREKLTKEIFGSVDT